MGDALTAASDLAVPHRLGRYEIVAPIANAIYLARVQGTEEPYVALELVRSSDPELATALVDEAKLIVRARHRNLVQLLDVDHCELGVFLVMDYVPGDSLASLQRLALAEGSPLPRPIVLAILGDALLGLHVLHEHTGIDGQTLGLVHRDLSASSILVGTDGIARVTGFGVARALDANRGSAERFPGRAPELAAGGAVDRRCDLWSAGVIAWEALAARKLFDGELTSSAPPPRVTTVARDVDEKLAAVVEHALRLDPAQRPASAELLASALEGAARDAGFGATQDEIATLVSRLARPRLAERASRLAEARKAQQQRPLSMPDVRTMIGMGAPPALKRLPLPDLPARPASYDDGTSELRLEAALDQRRPAERASVDILGEATDAPASEPTPEIIHSPVVVHDSKPAASASPSLRAEPSGLHPLQLAAFRMFAPPWTTKKISTLAALGGALLGFFVVLAAVAGGGRKEAKGAPAASSSAPAITSAAAPVIAAPIDAGAPPEKAEKAETALLHLTANAPIATVQVGGRVVDTVVAAASVSVDLTDDERDSALRLVVTASDGRTATLTTTAGELEIEVIFQKAAQRPSHPASTTTVKRPWTKRPR